MADIATLSDFRGWVERDFGRFASKDDVEIIDSNPTILKFRVYTAINAYMVTASVPGSVGQTGYLGAQASSRMPRAGETWTRGRDLSDGPLTEATWREILGDIVSFEMVKVHKPQMTPTAHIEA